MLSFLSCLSYSQFSQGSIAIGSEIRFLGQQSALFDNVFENGDSKSTLLTISGSFGYYIAENIQIGIRAGRTKSEIDATYLERGVSVRSSESKSDIFVGTSFGYQVFVTNKLIIPFSADLSYHWLDTVINADAQNDRTMETDGAVVNFLFNGYQYQLNTGIEYLISNNIASNVILSYGNKDGFRTESSGFNIGAGIKLYINRKMHINDLAIKSESNNPQ